MQLEVITQEPAEKLKPHYSLIKVFKDNKLYWVIFSKYGLPAFYFV